MAGFGKSVASNVAKIKSTVNNQCYQITKELFTAIVLATPSPENPGHWAKGQLANQWYTVDGPEFSSEAGTETSPSGEASLSRITALIAGPTGKQFLGKDGAVTMANNLPYVSLAETWGWPWPKWSGTVGPYRMVALSLQAIAAKYQ